MSQLKVWMKIRWTVITEVKSHIFLILQCEKIIWILYYKRASITLLTYIWDTIDNNNTAITRSLLILVQKDLNVTIKRGYK